MGNFEDGRSKAKSGSGDQVDVILVGLIFSALSFLIFAAVFMLFNGDRVDSPPLVLLLVFTFIVTIFVAFYFGRTQGRTEAGVVRIALGGAPGSGKTVFVSVLMNVLLEETDLGMRFTPETRTAAAAIAAAQRLATDKWPLPTSEGGLFRYAGTLERTGSTPLREFLGLNSDVRLEVADNAGELWQQLGREGDRGRGTASELPPDVFNLTSSNFFEYVTSAHSLLYMISAEDLLAGPERCRVVVEDAISVFKLVLATRGPAARARTTRVGLVLSKADLLNDLQLGIVSELLRGRGEFSSEEAFGANEELAKSGDFGSSIECLERLVSVVSSRADDYFGFTISSVASAFAARIIGDDFLSANSIPNGPLIRFARRKWASTTGRDLIADPVLWTLARYWRDRRDGRRAV